MEMDQFLQNALLMLTDYRDNSRIFPASDDFQFIDFCLSNIHHSRSQLLQDLFVLYELRARPGGFFVEFGATDGVELSNTHQLEKRFQWSGILAEPARCWHQSLSRNRNCLIDARCVWEETGKYIEFTEANSAEFSTIEAFSDSDHHSDKRAGGSTYQVETVSLLDLLVEHRAPKKIDYVSIDTEGSELAILSGFDFSRFDIRTITVEHNYTAARDGIHSVLVKNGFVRKFEKFSRWDDWYVKRP